MNILIFDPLPVGQVSACYCLRRKFKRIVCVSNLHKICAKIRSRRVQIFHIAIFIIPSVTKCNDGTIIPHSERAENILEIACAATLAKIHTFVFSQTEVPPAYFDSETGREISAKQAFFRPIDQETNTFAGCFIGRDWEVIMEEVWESFAFAEK